MDLPAYFAGPLNDIDRRSGMSRWRWLVRTGHLAALLWGAGAISPEAVWAQAPCQFIGPRGGATFLKFQTLGWFTKEEQADETVGGPFEVRASVSPPKDGCRIGVSIQDAHTITLSPLGLRVRHTPEDILNRAPIAASSNFGAIYEAFDDLSNIDEACQLTLKAGRNCSVNAKLAFGINPRMGPPFVASEVEFHIVEVQMDIVPNPRVPFPVPFRRLVK
jgi:hypothetical protein